MRGLDTSTSLGVARTLAATGMDANGEEESGEGGEIYERSMSPVERLRMQEEEEPMGICGKSSLHLVSTRHKIERGRESAFHAHSR